MPIFIDFAGKNPAVFHNIYIKNIIIIIFKDLF